MPEAPFPTDRTIALSKVNDCLQGFAVLFDNPYSVRFAGSDHAIPHMASVATRLGLLGADPFLSGQEIEARMHHLVKELVPDGPDGSQPLKRIKAMVERSGDKRAIFDVSKDQRLQEERIFSAMKKIEDASGVYIADDVPNGFEKSKGANRNAIRIR